MTLTKSISLLYIFIQLWCVSTTAFTAEIRVAVASNFSATLKRLSSHFEQTSLHKVILISGSTGKLYAQIQQGAPFDVFLAADDKHPVLLETQGKSQAGTRFTYAIGKLILWSSDIHYVDNAGLILHRGEFDFLSIANPGFAPYGIAAKEVMRSLGIWKKLQKKLVRGDNITQAYQYVKTGNAQLGFIAFSQIKQPALPVYGSYWEIPLRYYTPIKQQAVLLHNNTAAREFLSYLKTPAALKIIRSFGYITSDAN